MKIICKKTTSQDFDLKEVTTVSSNNFDYTFGGYGLELNKEYIVMGMVTYQDSNSVYYLIDVNGKPGWFPYLLFDISDNSLSKDWFIKVYGKMKDIKIYSICGFNELCNNEDFYDLLVERNEEAMLVYFKRKKEMEIG